MTQVLRGLPRVAARLLLAVLPLAACSDRSDAEQGTWTNEERAAFKSFRESAGTERLELAREVVHVLPQVLNTVTLEVDRSGPMPSEAEVLQQIGPSDASFPLDHHPRYMGGRVAPSVQLHDYRVHIYELGCNDGKSARAERPSEEGVLCSSLDLVTFKQQVVATVISHESPQWLLPWLSAQ